MGNTPALPVAPRRTLPLLTKAVQAPAPDLAFLLKRRQQPGELTRVQAGQRTQEPGFAKNGFYVHASCLTGASILSTIKSFIYWLLDTKDSTTSQYACFYCELSVLPKDEVPLLTKLAERATQGPVNNNVFLNILTVSVHQRNSSQQTGVWSEKLESLAWHQKDNADRRIRTYIIRYINCWAKGDYRDEVLSFLNDKETDVLQGAIDAIADWPDRIEVYTKYLAEHKGDSTYASGVHFIYDLESGW